MSPAVVFSSSDLSIDETIYRFMANDSLAMFLGKATCDLLWRPAKLKTVAFIDIATSREDPNPVNTSVNLRLPSNGNPEGSREYQVEIPKPLYELIQKMQPIYEAQQKVRFGK